jgi:hypothetical protein
VKKIITNAALVLTALCLNFGLFLYTYKKLAFPYLHEAQRMENAPLIFSYVLLGFLVCSIFSVALSVKISK